MGVYKMTILKRNYLFTFTVLLIAINTFGQVDSVNNLIWVDVIPHFDINDKLEYLGDVSYRTSTAGDKNEQLVFKPTIFYNWKKKVGLLGGIGLFLTWQKKDYNTVELRPYQGVRFGWPHIWRLNFKHRAILEERLLWNNDGDYDPALRFRYRLKTKFPINKPTMQNKTFYIPMSFELFANAGGENVELFQNRNRAMIGLGYVLKSNWIAEFEVTFQRSRNTTLDDFILSDRIFRFKMTYNGWVFGE